ncbi:MAG: DUF4836 family protein [Odoribacteraceae bacterium]|jgi:hypothetical protein|nr:DUF4836 family protein [Odoribacteraceae bacterium]
MKKVKSILFLIPVLAGMMLASCQPGAKNSLYQVVPANTPMLLSVRVEQLLQKSEVAKYLIPMLENMPSHGVQQQVLELLKDVNALGIDLSEAVVFVNDGASGGLVLGIKNRAKFKKFLDLLAEEGIISEITKEEGFSHTSIDGGVLLTFNDHTLLVTPKSGGETSAKRASRELLTQSKEKSLLGNEAFAKTITTGEEFVMYMNMGSLVQMVPQATAMMSIGGMDLSKLSGVVKIAFPDGAARMTVEALSYDPAMLNTEVSRPLTRSLLEYFPASIMGTMIANMNGEAYYNMLKQSLGNMQAALMMFDQNPDIPFNMVFEALESLGSIDGEYMLNVVPGLPIPAALLYAEVKDNRLLEMINQYAFRLAAPTKLEGDSYRVDMDGFPVSLYYGIKNGLFFLTTDANLYANAGQKVENSFKDSPLAQRIPAGTNGYFLVDLATVIQPLNLLLGLSGNGSIIPTLSQLQYLEGFSENGGTTFVMQLELKDKTQNVLKLITEAIAKQF